MPAPVLQFKRGNAGVAGTVPALRPGEPAISLNNFDFFIGIDTSVANNKFFGSHRYWEREDGSNSLKLKLVSNNGQESVNLRAPTGLGATVTYTLPGTQGGNNTVLTNDGSGNLTWGSGSSNPIFSGVSTFSDTTDNTLGNPDTGAVQIDGGLGVNKNVTVGGNLNVQGYSELVGVVTFKGGTINLGDADTDDINVAGEFISNLVPNTDNTYDIGNGSASKRWRHASFSGIGTFAEGLVADNVRLGIGGNGVVDTTTGILYLDSAAGTTVINDHLDVFGDIDVQGNVYIGGTTVTLRGQDVFIENKDIVLGYTTSVTPNDTTANHAGVAIASTEGTPLVNFAASGINTLPDTYKQMMWFKSGTLGFSTDVFGFNYGVAIGTTTMANGVRLAVGSGITMSDTSISATNFYGTLVGSVTGNVSSADQVKTVTAGDDNSIPYYITFVNSHNGSATNETVYTDDGIYYNPGDNKFTTQHALFTGNVEVQGTLTGTATTATRATLIDTANTTNNSSYYVTFVDTLAGQNSENLRVGIGLSVNPFTGNVGVTSTLSVGSVNEVNAFIKAGGGSSNALYLYGNGDVSFQAKAIVNEIRSASNASTLITLSDLDATFARNVNIVGVTTTSQLTIGTGVAVTQFSGSVSTGSSASSVPTSKAVIDYVRDNVDLTLGLTADTGGPSTVNTSQTLTISGTASEVETSVSGQTVTIGLPDAVVVGTSLSAPTIRTGTIQSSNTGATAITIAANDVTIADDLTVGGNLYVNGSTTQVNTTSMTVEDRTVELGVVDGSAPGSATTWDLGVLFNYYTDAAKKSAVIWEHGDSRFKFASILDADTNGTNASTPQLTVNTFAPIEIGSLWINGCGALGALEVIKCDTTQILLQNVTIDAGGF